MKILSRVVVLLVIVFCFYSIWVLIGVPERTAVLTTSSIAKDVNINIGSDLNKGNILGIQPYLTAINYANIPTFKQTIRAYLAEAKNKNLINAKTVVVLPEHIGSFLFAYEEKQLVYDKPTLEEAMKAIVSANVIKYGFTYFSSPAGNDKAKYAALALKADQSAKIYWEIFAELAKEFNVIIAAGSIVLPDATRTSTGTITVKNGILYNTAAIFNNDGKITNELDRALFPIEYLSGFTKSFESSARIYNKDEATSGWHNYNPNSKLVDTLIHNGMALSLAGQLWDKKQDGRALIIQNGVTTIIPAATNGRIINLWVN